MDHLKFLSELLQDVQALKYRNKDHLDKILRRGAMIIRNIYGDRSPYLFDLANIDYYPDFAPSTEEYKSEKWESGKNQIINLLNTMLEEQTLFGKQTIARRDKKKKPINDNRVFIVHGHDDEAKVKVARFIEKLGFEAVILHEQPSKGKTIIEKFEEHASSSGFAIVLLTPDDVGYAQNDTDNAKPRARQNVIFELGYFCGTLGRQRVCVLYKEGVEIPNDYMGVVYTLFDYAGAWQMELAKEMKVAGLEFDMNKAFA